MLVIKQSKNTQKEKQENDLCADGKKKKNLFSKVFTPIQYKVEKQYLLTIYSGLFRLIPSLNESDTKQKADCNP